MRDAYGPPRSGYLFIDITLLCSIYGTTGRNLNGCEDVIRTTRPFSARLCGASVCLHSFCLQSFALSCVSEVRTHLHFWLYKCPCEYTQVSLMLKTGPLSGNCVQLSYKLSTNMHWWKLVAEEQMQLRVSGHLQLTLHAAADR